MTLKMVINLKWNRDTWMKFGLGAIVVIVMLVIFAMPHYIPKAVDKKQSIGVGIATINRMQDFQDSDKVSITFKEMENTKPVYVYVDHHFVKKIKIDDPDQKVTISLGSGKVADVGHHQLKCVQYRTWYPSKQILFLRTLDYSIR